MRPTADLRGEADALALAAGERAGGARQSEIVEADIDQELEPLADFLEHAAGDLVLLGVELFGDVGEPFAGLAHRQLGDLRDVLPADLDAQRLGLEPGAVADMAGHVGEIFLQVLARPVALGLLEAALKIGDDAFERLLRRVAAQAVVIDEFDLVLAGAVEDRILRLLRQVLPLCFQREAVMLRQRGERLDVIGRTRLRPGRDGALAQGGVLVRDDQLGVDVLLEAEPAAFRTGAERIVEREQPRLDLRNGEAGHRAGEFFGEDQALGIGIAAAVGGGARRLAVGEFDHGEAVGELQALLQRIRQPRADVAFHHQAVDHHVDVMGEFLVERLDLLDLVEGAVDLDALIALAQELGQLLAVLALAPAHDRRQHIDARAFRQRQHAVDHLRDRLALDRQTGGRRVGHADARPEQAHVVVDLGDGADGRARVLRGGLLFDGNSRRQAVDLVDVRLLHHLEELPRIGGEQLDIAPLPLGIDGVEGERGFAGARQAGEHDQLVARNGDVDILEVMLARATDRNHAGIAWFLLGKFGH